MTTYAQRRSQRLSEATRRPPVDLGPMLRLGDVVERTTLSESCIRRLVRAGMFPPFVCLGVRARGLPELVLDTWLAQCLALRAGMRTLLDDVELPPWPGVPAVVVPSTGIRMVRRREVEQLVGLRKSAIFRRINAGDFPAPAPLGERVRRWARHEIAGWIAARDEALHLVRDPRGPWVPPRHLARRL